MSRVAPLARVEMLERSLRCFTLGLIGVVPILGLPAALFALFDLNAVVGRQQGQWNAAHRYVLWGGWLAGIGILLSLLALTLLALVLVNEWSSF